MDIAIYYNTQRGFQPETDPFTVHVWLKLHIQLSFLKKIISNEYSQ